MIKNRTFDSDQTELFNLTPSTKRRLIRFRISAKTKKRMLHHMIDNGYGARGKARWVEEAIDDFLNETYWKSMTIEIDGVGECGEPDNASISEETWTRCWRAVLQAAQYGADEREPPYYMTFSIGLIVRAAITWRLGQDKSQVGI